MYKFKNNLKKFFVITTVIMVCVLLCILGIYAFKSQISNSDPISAVRAELNDIADREYTLDLEIISIDIDPDESERMINTYKGSELAKERGWTNEQLNDLTAVKAIYRTEYDHSKTFIDDGYTEQYFYLIKDDPSGAWEIADISDPHILNIPKDDDTANTEAASTVDLQRSEELYCSVDLNYDGITEDFFISSDSPYDEFSIVMYDDTEKKHISDKTKIYRTEKIDIYKESGENNTEYYYAVFEGSAYKSFQLNCLYTGNNKSEHCFGGYSYGENLSSPIYCFVYNSTVYKKDFDELINDNKSYLYKYDDLEYVTTIDLTNYYNPKYSEEYLSEINICDGMKKILLYNLENDIFDKSIKLTNGTYSYYANKCSNIEIYSRPRRVWEYDSNGEAYISEAVDDYDYLLCLKSSDEKNVELIYLGNKIESKLVSYYCYSDTSYAATQSGIDGDIENFNSIMNDSASFLKRDGWTYYDDIKLVKG